VVGHARRYDFGRTLGRARPAVGDLHPRDPQAAVGDGLVPQAAPPTSIDSLGRQFTDGGSDVQRE